MLKGVEKWRGMVNAELERIKSPLPPEHILALMYRESRGNPDALSHVGAMGLMQVMPVSLKWYNQKNKTNISISQFKRSPQLQIRVGIWVLQMFMRTVFRYLKKRLGEVALDDLVRITDTWYAAGPGNVKPRLNKIKPIWEVIAATYPKWDRVKPAELIWDRANAGGAAWDLPAINKWLSAALIWDRQQTIGGAALALAIIAVTWWWLKKGKQ